MFFVTWLSFQSTLHQFVEAWLIWIGLLSTNTLRLILRLVAVLWDFNSQLGPLWFFSSRMAFRLNIHTISWILLQFKAKVIVWNNGFSSPWTFFTACDLVSVTWSYFKRVIGKWFGLPIGLITHVHLFHFVKQLVSYCLGKLYSHSATKYQWLIFLAFVWFSFWWLLHIRIWFKRRGFIKSTTATNDWKLCAWITRLTHMIFLLCMFFYYYRCSDLFFSLCSLN